MMEYTWRWFGPQDPITLKEIKQTGTSSIVTALHHIPVGEVWEVKEIYKRLQLIQNAGFSWKVVESVPVHEDIKRQSGNFRDKIENYKTTLRNLGKSGVRTVCYNFMPILDWSRTNLVYKFADGSEVTGFEYVSFMAFDIYILKRDKAESSYPSKLVKKAYKYYTTLSKAGIKRLTDTVLLGLPGSLEAYTMDKLREILQSYEGIDSQKLRNHLFYFINEILPVAEDEGIHLAIHPDDPPWPLLGLPRVVSTKFDLEEIIHYRDSEFNGVTLCTGSLGAGHFNDIVSIAKNISHRINFAHLRNVSRDESLNFHENFLFDGDVDMYQVVKTLVREQIRRKKEERFDWQIPMRPDHGNQMLGDIGKKNYPGYSLYGRMKNMAEIRGLEMGITGNLLTK